MIITIIDDHANQRPINKYSSCHYFVDGADYDSCVKEAQKLGISRKKADAQRIRTGFGAQWSNLLFAIIPCKKAGRESLFTIEDRSY